MAKEKNSSMKNIFACAVLVCSLSAATVSHAQEVSGGMPDVRPNIRNDDGTTDNGIDPLTGRKCACQVHRLANSINAALPRFVQVMMLDSLPAGAEKIAVLTMEETPAADSTDNTGYKKFYAILQLKSQARQVGANALIGFTQWIDDKTHKLVFAATAAKVDTK
ncbi:MAG: hypothetical protein IAF08_04570 [Rhizobacter sp.]|nr:hypothetical protein [Chlorobiales bacterium]